MGKLRSPADLDKPLRDAAREKVAKYQSDYANDQRITFMPAAFSTSGRIDAEFLRLIDGWGESRETFTQNSTRENVKT